MGIFKGKVDPSTLPKVRYEIKGQEVDLDKVNRLLRKLLTSIGSKHQRNFAHLVHPETGERPDLLIIVPDPSKPSVQCRLVTDSPVMREWLKTKSNVIGEVVADQASSAS